MAKKMMRILTLETLTLSKSTLGDPCHQSIERGEKEMLLGQQLPMIQFQSGVWLDKKPLNRMMTSSNHSNDDIIKPFE
jgi:hypothetical protein